MVEFGGRPPVDGNDIETTIDVSMQDAAEKALLKQLKNNNGDVGVVVLMEVATGDVKATVNMTKCADGEYREVKNNAVSDLMEPGSTFLRPLPSWWRWRTERFRRMIS